MSRVRAPARLVLSWVMIGLVAACAAPGTKVTGAGVAAAELDAWEAAGRLGVAAGGRGGSGSFLWQQSGEQSLIRLSGPVGIGGMQVEVDRADFRVATSDGHVFESEAAHHALEARLGADVPAASLRYWVIGLAAPGPHRWSETADGRRRLEQDGWSIEYGEFTTHGRTELPTRLTATAGETRVRLVIDRWALGTPR